MNWDLLDFLVFGFMLASGAAVYALVVRMTANGAYRLAVGVALFAAFLLVWVNGAVGIIGDEGNDANLMYFGVLAVAVCAAAIVRFRAAGMARAMFAAAIAQVTVAVVALAAGLGLDGPAWPQDIFVMTLFFAALWLTSGYLFRKAAAE